MKRSSACLPLPFILAVLGVTGCTSENVVNPLPALRFVVPRGATLFVSSSGGTVRTVFDGRLRNPPVLCETTQAQLDTSKPGPSLRHTLKLFATRPGHARVQFHDPRGKLIGQGYFCIFPTLKTENAAIKRLYTVEVPPKVLDQVKQGRPVAVFQGYRPITAESAKWVHIAWVLYLDPML